MTDLQVKYQSLQEEKRHNAEMEKYTKLKNEADARKSNAQAAEQEAATAWMEWSQPDGLGGSIKNRTWMQGATMSKDLGSAIKSIGSTLSGFGALFK